MNELDELRASVRGFLADPGYSWARLTGELGLTALAVPESRGGFGATLVEAGVALEEAGAALLAAPLLSTVTAAAALDPSAAAAARLLPALAEGTTIATLALGGSCTAAGGRLTGTVGHVLDGDAADVFVVAAGPDLWAVSAGPVDVRPHPTLDQTRGQATIVLDGVAAEPVAPGGAAHALDVLHAGLAAESLGVARATLAIVVEHLRTRRQFGVPLATFQALRHRVADLHVLVEQATSSVWYALRAAGTDEFRTAAPLAKLTAAEAAWTVTTQAIQLLGGIGFTWEHPAHRYLKRATANRQLALDPVALRRLLLSRALG